MASPNGYYNEDNQESEAEQLRQSFSSPKTPITRTVAIIKNHALEHRFDIERRIQEASFEIVKERQMEFDTETDPETLEELFGDDTDSLAEGPVWVYVLERKRAVQVWHTLMGPADPEQGSEEAPNALRSLYGRSAAQNGLMGSPDDQTAEVQIAALFASSPPFPTSELPPEDDRYNSINSVPDSILSDLRQQLISDEHYEASNGYAPSNATNPSTLNGSQTQLNANGKPLFRARPIPASLIKPDIVPRTTKAAALRAGQPIEKTVTTPRKPVTKERLKETFANVPGHKRSTTIAVASTAAPVIAPRMTRAASLRLGQTPAPPPIRRRALTDEDAVKKNTFEGVPGHKRRETISVASVRAPTVAPRLNKSAALRVQKEQAPPTSFMFKGPGIPKTPLSRSPSTDKLSPSRPVIQVRPASQASVQPSQPARRTVGPRASSAAAFRPPAKSPTPPSAPTLKGAAASEPKKSLAPPVKARPRSSMGAPTIAPRTNKSALLRAAKQEAEAAAAAAAAAAKKAGKGVRPPPSSFKTVATEI